jgi:transforming growth factor-beta-induced protein
MKYLFFFVLIALCFSSSLSFEIEEEFKFDPMQVVLDQLMHSAVAHKRNVEETEQIVSNPLPDAPASNTLIDVLTKDGRFTTLLTLLKTFKLDTVLATPGPFTIFAPTDAAFALLPSNYFSSLTNQQVVGTLLYHVVPGNVPFYSFRNGTKLATLHQGQMIDVVVKNCITLLNPPVPPPPAPPAPAPPTPNYCPNEPRSNYPSPAPTPAPARAPAQSSLTMNGPKIIQSDLKASNGLIHVIDRPLPLKNILQVAADFGHTTFVAAAQALGSYCGFSLTSSSDPRTVFVPTNDAFAALPAGTLANLLLPANQAQLADILRYHLHTGHSYYLNDFYAGETLLTSVNRSLLSINVNVSGYFFNEALAINPDLVTSSGVFHVVDTVLLPRSILQILSGSYKFNTLLSLMQLANFQPPPLYTLFAPTDSAFDSISPALIAATVSNQELLRNVLNYHVVPGIVSSPCSWSNFTQLPTANGKTLTILLPNTVNTATITLTDHFATDGVVHFIDTLLLPPQ